MVVVSEVYEGEEFLLKTILFIIEFNLPYKVSLHGVILGIYIAQDKVSKLAFFSLLLILVCLKISTKSISFTELSYMKWLSKFITGINLQCSLSSKCLWVFVCFLGQDEEGGVPSNQLKSMGLFIFLVKNFSNSLFQVYLK